jgi:hypothetical protein
LSVRAFVEKPIQPIPDLIGDLTCWFACRKTIKVPRPVIGKPCAAIIDLPRSMTGIESCGMLLSAVHQENGEEKLHLLQLDPHIPAGAKLY